MANLRRPKGKRKYTHTGVRINYYGETKLYFSTRPLSNGKISLVHGLMRKEDKWGFMDYLQLVN